MLITGGSSGIGKHVAGDLLRKGAQVGIVAHDPIKLDSAESDLRRISADRLVSPVRRGRARRRTGNGSGLPAEV